MEFYLNLDVAFMLYVSGDDISDVVCFTENRVSTMISLTSSCRFREKQFPRHICGTNILEKYLSTSL